MIDYFGCCLETKLSKKSIAIKSLRKVNTNLQFLYEQTEFLNSKLRWFLFNYLIPSHFN